MESQFSRYDLHERLIEQLPRVGYFQPTPVQHKVIPLIIQGKNLIVEAATGTGKTAAYGLPYLSKVNHLKKSTQFLILVPSRELAMQVEAELQSFSSFPQLKIVAIYGGSPISSCRKKLAGSPQVVIAVPGRLRDVLSEDDFPWFWRDIKYFVIDEADKLMEPAFKHETEILIGQVRNSAQVALFSATIRKEVEELIRGYFRPILTVRLAPKEAVKNIQFYKVSVPDGRSSEWLAAMIKKEHIARSLIFCNKREEVYSVTNFLRSLGYKVDSYHGLMDQIEREAVMSRFKKSLSDFLVSTDLGARGLDVEYLPAVINYSLPPELDIYLHRVGRTGRAGMRGECFNIVKSKAEANLLATFHKTIGIKVKESKTVVKGTADTSKNKESKWVKVHISRGKKDKLRKGDIVGFLTQNEGIQADEIGTISVYDEYTTVDIPQGYVSQLEELGKTKIKGKTVKIRKFGLEEQKKRASAVQKLVISSSRRKKTRGTQ